MSAIGKLRHKTAFVDAPLRFGPITSGSTTVAGTKDLAVDLVKNVGENISLRRGVVVNSGPIFKS